MFKAKFKLLLKGLDIDFNSLSKMPLNIDNYKMNRARVSDRHFMDPEDKRRRLMSDELILKKKSGKEVF